MKAKHQLKIGVVLWMNQDYGRRILTGVMDFVHANRGKGLRLQFAEPSIKGGLRPFQAECDGVVAAAGMDPMNPRDLSASRPVVATTMFRALPGVPRVAVSERSAAAAAAEHFLSLGLRSMAAVIPAGWDRMDSLVHAFRQAAESGGGAYLGAATVNDSPHAARSSPSMRRWIADLPNPVGIFTVNDALAQEILELAARAKRSVPDDVAVLGIGNEPFRCLAVEPQLSSVALPAERTGYLAAEMLVRMLNGEKGESIDVPPEGVVARDSTDTVGGRDPQVAKAVRFIRTHFPEDISLSDVAKHVGLSIHWLRRRFDHALGRTVHEELVRCRLAMARHLLVTTNTPIKTIAVETGYRRIEHFGRYFRARTGLTPTQYRNRNAATRPA